MANFLLKKISLQHIISYYYGNNPRVSNQLANKKYKRTSRINHIKAHEKIIWFDNLCLFHK